MHGFPSRSCFVCDLFRSGNRLRAFVDLFVGVSAHSALAFHMRTAYVLASVASYVAAVAFEVVEEHSKAMYRSRLAMDKQHLRDN